MSVVKMDPKFTKVQNALFERAHSQPCELKFVAIGLSKQGIQTGKLYSHPEMIPLPIMMCDYLSKLGPEHRSILSALTWTHAYKYIARSEMQTIASNMYVAERVFDQYSDDYMVLQQETNEEYDHIWSFRTIHKMVCREAQLPNEKFDEIGFFDGEVGAAPETKDLLGSEYKFMHYMVGSAVQNMPNEVVQGAGLGALWLLYRYIANVQLKQTEAFFFESPEKFNYDPLAVELTNAHLTDEARHYTTSLDMGMELFRAADPWAKKFIRLMITEMLQNYIRAYYVTYGEMIHLGETQGVYCTPYKIGLNALRVALNHPAFKDHPVEISTLTRAWHEKQVGMELGPINKKRWRYAAQQIERLIDALGLKLDADEIGVNYERHQKALTFAS
ncbi:hypothetical protein [Candidatus Cyanaurora vandensis]|uniref:hypothetical protein n=1 Tax=Candidatus Cyanaurora vandensis TaxID=2714958 RepID=UPI00257EF554|nr:hypothetical protein [Candidatus Cyanaurora vandensis]